MIKGFNPFNKSNISSLSNCDGQTTYLKKETEKTMDVVKQSETIISTNHNPGQHSQKRVKKFRKIAKSSDPQQQNSSSSDNNVSKPQTDVVSIPNGEFKLKGILKNSTATRSYSDLINEPCSNHHNFQRIQSYPGLRKTKHNKENHNDLTSSNSDNNIQRSVSNSSITDKRVLFSDDISTKKYKPNQPVSNIANLSRRQRKKLNKRQRIGLLELNSMDETEENCVDLTQFQDFKFSEINENESSNED